MRKEMRKIMAEFWDIYDENRNKTDNKQKEMYTNLKMENIILL